MDFFAWLVPWEPVPLWWAAFAAAALLFVRGSRARRVGRARRILFWSGLVLTWLVLQTELDYYAQHLFFLHRAQHLELHHLGPLLIMGAYPGQVMRAGLPAGGRRALAGFLRSSAGRATQALLTHVVLIPVIFVLMVLVWLLPHVQFISMLDSRIYHVMNGSVIVSGLLYWNLILDRRPSPPAAMRPGARVLSPLLTMVPQMAAGAVIAFTERDLYPVFELCGRAFGMTARADQLLGGLIIWIPASLIELTGLLIALRMLMQLSERGRLRSVDREVRSLGRARTGSTGT
jgi:putative membrane protein